MTFQELPEPLQVYGVRGSRDPWDGLAPSAGKALQPHSQALGLQPVPSQLPPALESQPDIQEPVIQRVASSRWFSLQQGGFKQFVAPVTVRVTKEGIVKEVPRSRWCPWVKEVEMVPFNRVVGIQLQQGVLWNQVSIAYLGGSSPLVIQGLRKSQAKKLVAWLFGKG